MSRKQEYLTFRRELAKVIGLPEATILHSMEHLMKGSSGKEIDGEKWLYNSYEEWAQMFDVWSVVTIGRAIRNLEKAKLIVSKQPGGRQTRRKYYRLAPDYRDQIDTIIVSKRHDDGIKMIRSSDQNDTFLYNRGSAGNPQEINNSIPLGIPDQEEVFGDRIVVEFNKLAKGNPLLYPVTKITEDLQEALDKADSQSLSFETIREKISLLRPGKRHGLVGIIWDSIHYPL